MNEIQTHLRDQIVQASKGNPGAMMAAMEIQKQSSMSLNVVLSYGIVGTDLYVLFSDLCGRDVTKALKLIKECPESILKDACSRQDYSGRELVEAYL